MVRPVTRYPRPKVIDTRRIYYIGEERRVVDSLELHFVSTHVYNFLKLVRSSVGAVQNRCRAQVHSTLAVKWR